MSCITPYIVRKRTDNRAITVPCGRCPECVKRKVSGWSFRLMQEERNSSSAYFVTLTYDTRHVPITRKGYMSLSKRDVQLFLKRLRKLHYSKTDINLAENKRHDNISNNNRITYYAVGEYGSTTRRPHYHCILFNTTREKIAKAWSLGEIHIGQVTGASVGYTLKYMSKPSKQKHHANDDRQPQFALMSKGLGKAYLTPQMVQWHKNALIARMYVNLMEGKKASMPRYYKDKIYTEQERKRISHFVRLAQIEKEQTKEITSRDQAENDLAAFRRMDFQSQKADRL